MLALKTTPLHPRTSALMQGNQWRRWAGFSVASAYDLVADREYLSIRNACALIDVSPLFKYRVRGPDAHRFLNRLVTRDLGKMAVGQVAYTPWCDSRGKIVDDGTIARLADAEFRLTAAESNLRWLHDNAPGFDVEITCVSDDLAALALQGPTSRALLERLAGESLAGLKYHHLAHLEIGGVPVTVTRTGYTGDLGYEIWIPLGDRGAATGPGAPASGGGEGVAGGGSAALAVWDALTEEGKSFGLHPCGIWGMDVARIEAGLVMLDVDYTPAPRAFTEAQASSPFEIGLGWAVHLGKGDFVGRKALLAEKRRGSSLALVGLEIDHVVFAEAHERLGLTTPYPFIPWRAVVPVHVGREQVGHATCGAWSPALKRYIALAQVAPGSASPGTALSIELMVDRSRQAFTATVVPLPFLSLDRKRA